MAHEHASACGAFPMSPRHGSLLEMLGWGVDMTPRVASPVLLRTPSARWESRSGEDVAEAIGEAGEIAD